VVGDLVATADGGGERGRRLPEVERGGDRPELVGRHMDAEGEITRLLPLAFSQVLVAALAQHLRHPARKEDGGGAEVDAGAGAVEAA